MVLWMSLPSFEGEVELVPMVCGDGSVIIHAVDPETGYERFMATTCLDMRPGLGCAWLCDSDGREGLSEAVMASGAVRRTGRTLAVGNRRAEEVFVL
jgi:hypothetical protein